VIDSSGVRLVTYDGPDRPLSWALVPIARLGGSTDTTLDFSRIRRPEIAADRLGRLYILDHPARRVLVVDSAGSLLRSLGRGGSGPGELSDPVSLTVDDDGNVAVWNFGTQGIVTFDSAGRPGPTERVGFPPGDFTQPHFVHWGNGWLSAAEGRRQDDMIVSTLTMEGDGPDTDLVSVSRPPSRMTEFPSCGGALNLGPIFAPDLVWNANGRRMVVATSAEYRIDRFDADQLTESVRRRIGPLATTRELAESEFPEGFRINFGRGPCRIPASELVAGRGFAAVVPTIRNLMLAPAGELWVERRVAGSSGGGPIDIFDRDGQYVGTLADFPMPAAFLGHDRVAWIETDSLDVQRVVVGQVVR